MVLEAGMTLDRGSGRVSLNRREMILSQLTTTTATNIEDARRFCTARGG
jgi:hypothetical protein